MRCRRAWVPGLIAAPLVVLAAGCGSSASDKAGAASPAKPVVLTLAAHDDDEAYGTFAAAVDRLSGGSLRIRIAGNWRVTGTHREIDYERGIVDDVRSGKVPLGIVGVRVWDTLGVTSFQALVAPFMIDSLAVEAGALRLPFARLALASVRKAGVVGIALLPGRLRRPLGITRELVGPQDYHEARIGIRLSEVAGATFRALGATVAGYIPPYSPGDPPGFDGVELDPLTITENNMDEGARALTGNVVFWPKPQTIVMNRNAYDRLTSDQRRLLESAGREALAPELERIARDQQVGLSALCHGGLAIALATPSDLASLRHTVQPVYTRIERSRLTREWIAQITRLRGAEPAHPVALRCAGHTGKEKSP